MLLENINAVIYGGGRFIGSALAQTFAYVTGGTFPSYMTPASMTTQRRGKAA